MLRLCEPLERAPYALGVDELVLGRLHRPVRAALFNGDLARLEDLLNHQFFTTKTQRTQRIRTTEFRRLFRLRLKVNRISETKTPLLTLRCPLPSFLHDLSVICAICG